MTDPRSSELSQAEDPTTSPETLVSLASSKQPGVRQALARNPATPLASLIALCPDFPDDVWKNPALDLILLDRPEFFSALKEPQALALASSPLMPARLAPLLLEHRSADVARALGRNPSSPRDLLEGALLRKVPASVAVNPSTPWETLRELLGEMDEKIRIAAASNASIPAWWRRRCARLGLAGDLKEPPDVWPAVSSDDLEWLAEQGPWFRACASLFPMLLAGWPPPATLPPLYRELSGLRLRYGDWLVDGLLARATQQNHPPTEPFFTDRDEVTWWLLAPSLRAPMTLVRWLAGEQVHAGEPLVVLDSQGAQVTLEAPLSARLLPVFSGGRVTPGQPLARLIPDRPLRSFQGRRIALPELSLSSFPAPVVVPVPPLGESVVEVCLMNWQVKPGDRVRVDEIIVTAGMDKCDIDLQSPRSGLVLSTPEEGDTVAIGGRLMALLPFKDSSSE